MGTGFVAAESVSGFGDGAGILKKKVEGGVGIVEIAGIKLPAFDEACDAFTQIVGLAEGFAHGEHDLDADVVFNGFFEDGVTTALVEDVVADHEDVPEVVLCSALEHFVIGVFVEHLGDADEADFALFLGAFEYGVDVGDEVVVVLGHYAVEVVDVDVIGVEAFEALVETFFEGLRCDFFSAGGFFGGNNNMTSVAALEGFCDDGFGAVSFGGVDVVDACVKGLLEDGGGFGLGFARFFAELAGAATAHAHNAHGEVGSAEGCGLHFRFPFGIDTFHLVCW